MLELIKKNGEKNLWKILGRRLRLATLHLCKRSQERPLASDRGLMVSAGFERVSQSRLLRERCPRGCIVGTTSCRVSTGWLCPETGSWRRVHTLLRSPFPHPDLVRPPTPREGQPDADFFPSYDFFFHLGMSCYPKSVFFFSLVSPVELLSLC